jgi:hypothetical protein
VMRTSSSARRNSRLTHATVFLRTVAAATVALCFFMMPRPASAVIDGCILEKVVTARSTDIVLVKVHVQPDQRVNVVLGQPGGVVIYAERSRLRTDASGRLTVRFDLARLSYETGVPLQATAVTSDSDCDPGILRVVVVGTLPDTAAALPSDATPASSPAATWLAVLSGAAVAWLSRRRWAQRP